jgi:hypothetical protein
MSQSAITVVEISVSAAEAPPRAAEVTRWLLETGVMELNTERDDLRQPSRYRAGPGVLTAAPDFDEWSRHHLNNGIDVMTGRDVYHPYENTEPPDCPSCGATLDEDLHTSLIEPWLLGPEPSVRCAACQREAPLGDWVGHGNEWGQWAFQVGELAVCFNNWSALTQTFRTALGQRMGPRWRVVSAHM